MNQQSDTSVLRIVDAALNRANEGLRVVEDYLRMALDDGHLSRLAKQLRHDLAAAAQRVPHNHRAASRNTTGDVGTSITTTAEATRANAAQVVVASFARTQQALRSIEEFAKTFDPKLAAECEALRYRAYTLEKATCLSVRSRQVLSTANLYVLCDGDESDDVFAQQLRALGEGGARVVQLRNKHLSDRQLLARAAHMSQVARELGMLAIVNDRPDIAAAANADGVHLGQDDMSVAAARKAMGPDKLIGISTHHIGQARQATMDGADYLGAGPTFPSSTKQFDSFPGLSYLEEVAAEISLPTFAIGGIRAENIAEVLATGITRVAVAGAVTGASDPQRAAAELQALLDDASTSPAPSSTSAV